MKHLALCVLSALLTFSSGVGVVAVWSGCGLLEVTRPELVDSFEFPLGPSRSAEASEVPVADLPLTLTPQTEPKKFSIEDVCQPAARISYEGYEITNSFDPNTQAASIIVKKGGRTLVSHMAEVLQLDRSRIGLFRLLNGKAKQLILVQFSGGAHCCYSFWIYDLHPQFRLIFSSEKYPIEDYMDEAQFLDIDKNGVFEIEAPINSFAYFHGSFVESIMPPAIFGYDKRAGQYLPANQRLSTYALRGIDKEIAEIRRVNLQAGSGRYDPVYYDDYRRYFESSLDILLRYIYAGHKPKGWAFFDAEYKLSERYEEDELKKEIIKLLNKDSIYRFLYRR
jgi:hypothetical protein